MINQRTRVLAAMFWLGSYSVLAQVLFMREMLVVFLGNELSIGTILASWLVSIGLGAYSARLLLRCVFRCDNAAALPVASQWFVFGLLAVMAVLLPLQVYAIRAVRAVVGVPAGEYAPLGTILGSALTIFFPTCYCIGLIFPFACAMLVGGGAGRPAPEHDVPVHGGSVVSDVYMFEALGSMVGGVVLTFVLLPIMSPLRLMFIGAAILCVAAAFIVPVAAGELRVCKAGRYALTLRSAALLVAVCLVASAILAPGWLKVCEDRLVNVRWRSFGVIRDVDERDTEHSRGWPVVRLVSWANTVYQNLAVTESEDQFVLYGNGQVMFVFPDPMEYEHAVHFVMAQNPGAKSVLLLGGNPVGEIPELLKYPLDRLVYVEIDRGIGRAIRAIMPKQYDAVFSDARVIRVEEDAPRFVHRCDEQFDVILVNAPEPTTAAANRFYTLEFYRDARRILEQDGFLYTAVSSAARLQSESADLCASVFQTLTNIFPVVLVTAEPKNRFLAGNRDAGLSFDRAALCRRVAEAQISTRYFIPESFLGLDEIAPDKTEYVHDRLSSVSVPLNTNLRPVTYFYNLLLWSRYSGSRMARPLAALSKMNHWRLIAGLVLAGGICLAVGLTFRWHRARYASANHTWGSSPSAYWSRCMAGLLIATTGFCAMALEVVLVFVFQGLYGYVYTRMGLIVAMFMLGLVVGAPSGRALAGRGRRFTLVAMVGLELFLLVLALLIPVVVNAAACASSSVVVLRALEVCIYFAVMLVGWAVGAEFPLGNRMFCDAGGTVGAAVAITDASDHVGAAAGALVTGVILVPVLGIGSACVVLAAVKVLGIMLVGSVAATIPGKLQTPVTSCPDTRNRC